MSDVPASMPARRRFLAYNGSGEEIPPHGAVETTSIDSLGAFVCVKPNKDDSNTAFLNTESSIPPGGHGHITRHLPGWAKYNAADGNPVNGESLGTRAGFWELHRGYEGFLVWGGADGNKVYVQSDLTCREPGSGQYYYDSVDLPCCTAKVPKTICLNMTGSQIHDGGVLLHHHYSPGPDGNGNPTLPAWIPNITSLAPFTGLSGTCNSLSTHQCYLSPVGGLAALFRHANGPMNMWFSNLIEDMLCDWQEVTFVTTLPPAGVTRTVRVKYQYYNFFVLFGGNYSDSEYSGAAECAVHLYFVQIRRRWSEVIDNGVSSGVIDEGWDRVAAIRSKYTTNAGGVPPSQANCPSTYVCSPFVFDGGLYPVDIFATYPCSYYCFPHCACPILHPPDGITHFDAWVEEPCLDYAVCTEDEECHEEWQIVGYDEEENPIYDWVTVCTGLGTYTETGPHVEVFIC